MWHPSASRATIWSWSIIILLHQWDLTDWISARSALCGIAFPYFLIRGHFDPCFYFWVGISCSGRYRRWSEKVLHRLKWLSSFHVLWLRQFNALSDRVAFGEILSVVVVPALVSRTCEDTDSLFDRCLWYPILSFVEVTAAFEVLHACILIEYFLGLRLWLGPHEWFLLLMLKWRASVGMDNSLELFHFVSQIPFVLLSVMSLFLHLLDNFGKLWLEV